MLDRYLECTIGGGRTRHDGGLLDKESESRINAMLFLKVQICLGTKTRRSARRGWGVVVG